MAVFYKKPQVPHTEEENPYWMSFSDMMAGILIIFILVCIFLVIKLNEATEIQYKKTNLIKYEIIKLTKSLETLHNIVDDIQIKLERLGVKVDITNDTIIIPETALSFDSNRYDINEKNIVAAKKIGQVLSECISPFADDLETVFIEGHTDSYPSSVIKGNWGLSAFRAISLWEFWTKKTKTKTGLDYENEFGRSLDTMKNASGNPLFSVSGYAETRRLQPDESTDELRRQNRRINIRLVMKQVVTKKGLQEIIGDNHEIGEDSQH